MDSDSVAAEQWLRGTIEIHTNNIHVCKEVIQERISPSSLKSSTINLPLFEGVQQPQNSCHCQGLKKVLYRGK